MSKTLLEAIEKNVTNGQKFSKFNPSSKLVQYLYSSTFYGKENEYPTTAQSMDLSEKEFEEIRREYEEYAREENEISKKREKGNPNIKFGILGNVSISDLEEIFPYLSERYKNLRKHNDPELTPEKTYVDFLKEMKYYAQDNPDGLQFECAYYHFNNFCRDTLLSGNSYWPDGNLIIFFSKEEE